MEENSIQRIRSLIQEAEELGEKKEIIEHYQALLSYYLACLEALEHDIFQCNQILQSRSIL